MIWRPKVGQMVSIKYRPELRMKMAALLHGGVGEVKAVATGKKTVNALVEVWAGDGKLRLFVIPRGNLFKFEGIETED